MDGQEFPDENEPWHKNAFYINAQWQFKFMNNVFQVTYEAFTYATTVMAQKTLHLTCYLEVFYVPPTGSFQKKV
jgi:hypothetical protein